MTVLSPQSAEEYKKKVRQRGSGCSEEFSRIVVRVSGFVRIAIGTMMRDSGKLGKRVQENCVVAVRV